MLTHTRKKSSFELEVRPRGTDHGSMGHRCLTIEYLIILPNRRSHSRDINHSVRPVPRSPHWWFFTSSILCLCVPLVTSPWTGCPQSQPTGLPAQKQLLAASRNRKPRIRIDATWPSVVRTRRHAKIASTHAFMDSAVDVILLGGRGGATARVSSDTRGHRPKCTTVPYYHATTGRRPRAHER